MACTGRPLTTPSISCLDFLLAWDISGAQPMVTITNNSTISNNPALKWWIYVESPSHQPIYGVDLNTVGVLPTPDFIGAWTNKVVNLPTPFGNPPCGQIEFSPNSPYTVTVYVQDDAISPPVSFYDFSKTAVLVRPNGNNSNSCGNFGTAKVSMKVDCLGKAVQCFDSTSLVYNNILQPLSTSNLWTLVYPQDPSGAIPNRVATNVPNVNFPTSINSKGYTLYFNDYATYDYGNGITVKVQYKLSDKTGAGQVFAINCNTNLCLLQCQMQKFYELTKSACGVLENADLINKMTRMNWLFNEIVVGIFQPLCGIDVPKLIDEMKRIGNFDDNCDCNCSGSDFGFSNPTGAGTPAGGCCPSYTNVIDDSTGNPPLKCPADYFPVQVKDPTDTTVIGTAYNINDLVGILNANAAWQAYGTAFPAGNCKVGWFPINPAQIIPVIPVIIIPNVIIPTTTTGKIVIVGTTTPPPPCPASYFPVKVYNAPGTTIIGIANNITELVNLLNGDATWQAYGTAAPQGNCFVTWTLKDATVIPPDIQVDTNTGGTGCVNGSTIYTLIVSDICVGTGIATPADFPLNAYIDFNIGGGKIFLGNIADMAALIIAYNTTPTKPASITFSAGSTFGQIVVTNTNCVAYNAAPILTADLGSESFMLYGGNHSQMIASFPATCGEFGLGLAISAIIGKIPGYPSDVPVWHTITIGKYLLFTYPSFGSVIVFDVTDPINPLYVRTILLPDTASPPHCFTGIPETNSIASGGSPIHSFYDLYFPTDNPGQMSPTAVYVVESVSGSIWKLDITAPGSGIVAYFWDQQLRNKCPRVIMGGTTLYFTEDGDMGTTGGFSSGVAAGSIVTLDLTNFASGGISQKIIFTAPSEYVWAASFDGLSSIYFCGVNGTLAKFNTTTLAVTATYALAFPVANSRLNIKCFLNAIYASSLGFTATSTGTIRLLTSSLPTIVRTNFANFTPPGSIVANNNSHYNALPLGNCLVLVTYDNYQDSTSPQGGVAIFAVDGTFIGLIPLTGGNIYNVAAIKGVSVYAPTNLI